jgi:thioredoxin 1
MLSRRSVLMSVLLATGAAAVTPAFAVEPQPFDNQAFAEAQKAGKPIFVAIHATWCPTCKAQKPILSELMADPKFKNLVYFTIDFDSQGPGPSFRGPDAIDSDRVHRQQGAGPFGRRFQSGVDLRLAEHGVVSAVL